MGCDTATQRRGILNSCPWQGAVTQDTEALALNRPVSLDKIFSSLTPPLVTPG